MQTQIKLTIMPEFENLTVPMSGQQADELAASLIRQGCREPIAVWRGVILDGHKRYRICMMEQICYEVYEVECNSEEEAIVWVCRRRTAELSRGSQAFRYLMGRWYLAEVILSRTVKQPKVQTGGSYYERRGNRTSVRMSKEVGLHHSTLEKYGSYAMAMDALGREEPELLRAVMAGDIFLSMDNALELSRMEEKRRRNESRKLLRAAGRSARARYLMEDRKAARQAEEAEKIPLSIGIKEMPAPDPDMELQGLTLTMPAWISAMERALRRSDMSLVTDDARESLLAALKKLDEQVRITREALL